MKTSQFSCHIFESIHLFCCETIQSLYLPGINGDCEIYAQHMPIVQSLRPGVVKMNKDCNKTTYTFISGGIFFLNGDHSYIFTFRAVSLPDEKEETLAYALQHFSYNTLGDIGPIDPLNPSHS
jgi:F0F1-type ATP synthase epsilon subunit